ncbi:hypothetical protein C9422_27265, partial [Pseudomonas sp. B1(2018)]
MTTEQKAAATVKSPWKQATLLINGKKVEWGAEPVLLRGQVNDVTVEAPPEVAKALNLELPQNGGLNIVASPDFGNWVDPDNRKFEWKIKPDDGKSGLITLVFYSRDVEEGWYHRSLVISSNLADEVEVKIGGESVPAGGSVFFRGQAKDVELIPKSGSPIAGYPIALRRTATSPLLPTDLSSAPVFDDYQTTHKWSVTGTNNKSGIFQLQLTARGMSTPINVIANKLLSSNLADEVEVRIGGQSVPAGGSVFFRGQAKDVELVPKSGSPIAGYPIALKRTATSPLLPTDLSSAPVFDAPQTTHEWRVTGANNKSGIFQLQLTAQGMSTPINVTANKLLSTNLADEAVIKIDNVEPSNDEVPFLRNARRILTMEPR